MAQNQTGTRRSRRRRYPLAVRVVEEPETFDFHAWADQFAAVVVRLYREDLQRRAAA